MEKCDLIDVKSNRAGHLVSALYVRRWRARLFCYPHLLRADRTTIMVGGVNRSRPHGTARLNTGLGA